MIMEVRTQESLASMSTRAKLQLETRGHRDHTVRLQFRFRRDASYMFRSFEPFFDRGMPLNSAASRATSPATAARIRRRDLRGGSTRRSGTHGGIGRKVTFVNARFETASCPDAYDNVVLTHVLEHLDDPVALLARINAEWLARGQALPGLPERERAFATDRGEDGSDPAQRCRNAGGGRTRSPRHLLAGHARAGRRRRGAEGVHRSGIFFKALANFQWDRLLETDIISEEYLDGCYKLDSSIRTCARASS